jgi:hypothetical protein
MILQHSNIENNHLKTSNNNLQTLICTAKLKTKAISNKMCTFIYNKRKNPIFLWNFIELLKIDDWEHN